jgi:glyoxylase-like metal-dependent hydrolase (beta-lactamase superfamily II)
MDTNDATGEGGMPRRRFLRAATAAGAAAVVTAGTASAAEAAPGATATSGEPPTTATHPAVSAAAHPIAATIHTGPFEVIALTDAAGTFPEPASATFLGASSTDWDRARLLDPLAFGPGDAWNLDFRCFAVRSHNGMVTIVDTGIGPSNSPAASWAPVPGHLPDALAAHCIDPADVELVVLTHLHSDHAGWAVLPDGTPLFPDARYAIQHSEIQHLIDTNENTLLDYTVNPLRRSGNLQEVDGDAQLLKQHDGSLSVTPTPGHTIGHQSVVIDGRGGRQRVVITGDVLVHALQLINPDVAYIYEADQPTAAATRHTLFAEATRTRSLLATMHLKQPFVSVPDPQTDRRRAA